MATIDLGVVTAYAYAVAGGYTGTEQEFEELLGNIATDLAEIENLTVTANTLPAGSSATASYSNGVLTLGIPKGDKGDKGDTGSTGATGATGNGIASITLTNTVGAVHTYTITYTNGQTTTFDVTDGEVTTASLTATLADYARIDGYYEDLTAGYAENLISNVFEEDSVPYNFRTSGGSLDIGTFENDEVVGGSLAVNQLMQNGNFTTTDNWTTTRASLSVANNEGTVTVTAANDPYLQQSYTSVANHKYLISADVKRISGAPRIRLLAYYNGTANNAWSELTSPSSYQTLAVVVNNTTAGNNLLRVSETSPDIAVNDSFKVKNAQVIDLTQLFGTAIADYIYTLETGQAGAGVAWFKKLFPKSYYPYNTGELMHVQTSGHKTVGFNAYNNATGKAKLVGGMQYEIVGTYTSVSYTDISGNAETLTINNRKFTPTNNGELTVTGGNTTTCVHLVWDGERDGEYEAYSEHTYPLDSSLTLRGIPKLDSGNNLYYDGDTYESDGTVTRKYGVVDLGTFTWLYRTDTSVPIFQATGQISAKALPNADTIANAICNRYPTTTSNNVSQSGYDKTIAVNASGINIYIQDASYTDATAFKNSLSGVYLVYELATPTTETADAFQNPQAVSNWGTEEYIDERTIAIPVGHNTEYPADLKAKVETSPNPPDADGDYLVRHVNGENVYISLASNSTITDILNRLSALEG